MKFMYLLSLVAVMVAAMVSAQSEDSLHSLYYNILADPADRGTWMSSGAAGNLTGNGVAGATGGSLGTSGAASGTAAGSSPSSGSTANRIPTGKCPPLRKVCPTFLPKPKTCVYDTTCFRYQKCCYDRCHRRRVCKTKFFG